MKLIDIYEDIFSDSDKFMDIQFELEKRFRGKELYFHGTPRISKINNVSDIRPVKNTVDSKYLYVTPRIATALTFATVGRYKFGSDSGIIVFDIVGGKPYKFTNDDRTNLSNWDKFNERLDSIKAEGYDYVTGTQGNQEVIILNNNVLKLVEKIKIDELK